MFIVVYYTNIVYFIPSVEESGVESNRRLINYNVDIYIYIYGTRTVNQLYI